MKKTLFTSLLLATCLVTGVYATTLQRLTFDQLVNTSALIIEGTVESVRPVTSGKLVTTRVLIRVLDVLKGENPGEFVELDFLGGQAEQGSVTVAGQDIPEDGEKGFYFIESTTTGTVNPLTGWSQGHFRILSDLKGQEYLETEIRQEVVELSDNKNAVLANKLSNMGFSKALVEKAYFKPVTPDELRDAVDLFMTE